MPVKTLKLRNKDDRRSQTEIAGIALMAASKVVEKEANDKGNEKLLDDFLKEAGV